MDGAAKITKDLCLHGLLPESVEFLAPSQAGYENGIGMMSAEERRAASAKGYENGIGAMSAEARMAAVGGQVQSDMVKWMDNLTRVKTFIDTEGRTPSQKSGDADEKKLGRWMATNKRKEKGTNSECDKLMRRDIPLAFEDGRVQSGMVKWMDNLTRVKTFIDTEGRMPRENTGDADEKHLGRWMAANKRKEKGTNSERKKLMKKNIPLAFA
jgi:hypothetical protein